MNMIKRAMDKLYNHKLFPLFLFGIYFLIPFVVYRSYWMQGLVPAAGDGMNLMNIYEYVKYSIKNGELPLWNTLLVGGVPYASDISTGCFYPIRLIMAFLPIKWFWYCYYAIHIASGATFFYKYLLEIDCNRIMAIGGSILYFFSIQIGGMRKSHMQIITCIIFLPIILYFIEKYFNTLKMKYLYMASLAMALQFLIGFPQYALYSDIVAGLYIITLGIKKKINIKKWMKDAILWGLSYIGLIMVQIFPFIEMSLNYSAAGAGSTTMDTFRSFSMHPAKWLMMLVPKAYGEGVWVPMYSLGSSEMDIEIYMGSLVFSVILFSAAYYWKNFRVKFSIIAMLLTFTYIMNGCFDTLSAFFYKLPILNMFRVPSRSLFIFVFFALVLFSYGIMLIIKEKDYLRFSKFLFGECIVIILAALIGLSIINFISEGNGNVVDYEQFWLRYQSVIFVLAVCAAGMYAIDWIGNTKLKKENKFTEYSVMLFCVLITLLEVYPYWVQSASYDTKEYGINTDIEKQLSDSIGRGRIWLANPAISGEYQSIIKANANIAMGIPTINGFITFNNPRLSKLLTSEAIAEPSYNFSGLYTGFPEANKNVEFDNDVLSMLGVKYIIDQENIISDGQAVITGLGDGIDTLIEVEEQVVPVSSDLIVISYPLRLKSNAVYKLSFDCAVENEVEFYFDFFADGYDNPEQDIRFSTIPEEKSYERIVYSGDLPGQVTDVFLRFVVMENNQEFRITNIKVEEIESDIRKDIYQLYYQDENMKVYENMNYRDILYVPSTVNEIADMEEIYDNKWKYDLANNSYVMGMDSFKTARTTITDIDQKINRITAEIEADGDTFINFSQSYYPGWKCYIDGKRTELYMVNGLIQGMKIPAGIHEIMFVYRPTILYLGLGISSCILMILIVYLVKNRNNHS